MTAASLEFDRCSVLVLTGLGATGGPVLTDDDLIITSQSMPLSPIPQVHTVGTPTINQYSNALTILIIVTLQVKTSLVPT